VEFGAPLAHDAVTSKTFTKKRVVYQIGVAPVRIDISTYIDGITFAAAWRNRVAGTIFSVPVAFIALNDLIVNKRAAGRASDLEHLKYLEREANRKE
jgi:hypothetical protein